MPDLADPTTESINGIGVSKMSDVEVPDGVYEPMRTGIPVFDDFLSTKGGVPHAIIKVLGGEPGSGKTTVGCKTLAEIQKQGNKCLFISSEMDHVDFKEYSMRFPEFGNFYTFFPGIENDILESINKLIESGFDLILLDSFLDIKDKIAEQRKITKTKAELLLVDLLKKAKGGIEKDGKTYYTSWIVIQQMTKSGDLAGSKYLQHVVTSDLRLITENDKEEVRYMMFKKNRRGSAYEKLYYEIDEDEIEFDVERREREKEALDFLETEKERKEEEEFASIDELEDEFSPDENGEDESESSEKAQAIEKIFEANDGNISATKREAIAEGLWDEDKSYHFFRKFLHENGIDEYPQA